MEESEIGMLDIDTGIPGPSDLATNQSRAGEVKSTYKDRTSIEVGEGRSIYKYARARGGRKRASNQDEAAESRVPIGKER